MGIMQMRSSVVCVNCWLECCSKPGFSASQKSGNSVVEDADRTCSGLNKFRFRPNGSKTRETEQLNSQCASRDFSALQQSLTDE